MKRIATSAPTDHGAATAPQRDLADYYLWAEPDRAIRVYINLATADRLQVQVLGDVNSPPDRGMEVGGILLGTAEFDEGRITAIIDDLEAVPLEHSTGPQYRLSGADSLRFHRALTRRRSDRSTPLSVIGYYRSHRRDDLYLSPDDLALIRKAFPEPESIFLLVKPLPMRACTAGFFFWENGSIQSELTLEVPFAPIGWLSRPAPVSCEAESTGDLVSLLPERLDPVAERTTTAPIEPAQPVRSGTRAAGLFAMAAGVAAIGIAGYWEFERSKAPGPVSIAQPPPAAVEHAPAAAPAAHESQRKAAPPAKMEQRDHTSAAAPATAKRGDRSRKFDAAAISSYKPATLPVAELKTEPPPSFPGEPKISQPEGMASVVKAPPALPAPSPPEAEPIPQPQPSNVSYAAPQITYRVNPSIPLDVRSLISGEVQIDVTVGIDAAGRVTDAQVTSKRGAAAGLVTAEALKAAKLFRFQPARENDRAVQGRMVLTFRFRRTGD